MSGLGALQRHRAPVAAHDSIELRCGRMLGHLEQLRLDLGCGDPGDRAYLGVAQLSMGETLAQKRKLAERPRNPHVLSGRARVDPATPGDPRPAGVKSPGLVGIPSVELGRPVPATDRSQQRCAPRVRRSRARSTRWGRLPVRWLPPARSPWPSLLPLRTYVR